jgi:hypothetical protein
MNYEEKMSLGVKSPPKPSNFVKPSVSDFICEVELAARRLPLRLFALFDLIYLQARIDPNKIPSKVPKDFDEMKLQLGRMFRVRSLYPISKYFKGRFVGTHTEIKSE